MNEVLKVIYAPHKAFKEIIQNPKYLGPILVIILFAAAQTGFFYTFISKSYVEQTLPNAEQTDVWTQNATLWTASTGVIIGNDYDEFINGSYYGNSSIEFSAASSSQISMELNNIGPVNCYGVDGYKNLSVRIKLMSPQLKPENVSIYLFSLNSENYFYLNLNDEFFNSTANVWNNITIPVGSGDWISNSAAASWENITSLKLEFTWPSSSNLTLLVEGLFFRGIFKTVLEIAGSSYLANFVLTAFTQFVLQWLLLTGLLFIITRGLKGNVVWKPLMVAVGCALITLVIQSVANAALYTTLPAIHYPLELMAGVPGESDVAYQSILEATAAVSQISTIIQGITYVWTIGLCGITTRYLTGFTWPKSFLASAAAFLITILAMSFLLGY